MKPVTIVSLILAAAAVILLIISVAPEVGLKNSACERYPYTSGCR